MFSDSPANAATNQPVIHCEHVGKCYQIYAKPQHRFFQTVFRGRKQFYREFWALTDVSLDLAPGEALGIVGRNGSGKSTLLQTICGILKPTTGTVDVRGRVAALLELGSGFASEFTGRENVYMQGALLGLSRGQVTERFEEITRFADIGEFIEQPVKTYSSGMFVRLAFSVQVVLDPDILIVDEALAVGDAAFQVKCMNHMKRMLKRGVSVILVTHDVTSIRSFCHRAAWLHEGKMRECGPANEVTAAYTRFMFSGLPVRDLPEKTRDAMSAENPAQEDAQTEGSTVDSGEPTAPAPEQIPLELLDQMPNLVRWGSGEVKLEAAQAGGADGSRVIDYGEVVQIQIRARALENLTDEDVGLAFSIRNAKGLDIIAYTTFEAGFHFPQVRTGDRFEFLFTFNNILAPGKYSVVLAAEKARGKSREYLDFVENAFLLECLAEKPIFSAVLPPVQATLLAGPSIARRPSYDASAG